jgi:methionine synthase I (cobalamin-dependent)
VSAVNTRAYDTVLSDALVERDGATSTQLQAAAPTVDDFNDLERRNEVLNETRPHAIGTECVRLQSR